MAYSRIYSVNDNFFDLETPEKFWLIGLLASDGSIGRYNQIRLAQSGEDGLQLLKYVKDLIDAEIPIYRSKTTHKDSYSLVVSSEKMVNDLANYNIVRRKTYTYTMPDIPNEFLSDFIAGYIDGDGCITISSNNNGCKYLSVSFVGTQKFIIECQAIIPIKGNVRKHNNSNVYEIRWYGKKAILFCKWLYQHKRLYHGRKYNNFKIAEEHYNNSKEVRYAVIKEKVISDLRNGIDNIALYSKENNIPFQTIYKWKKQWVKEGVL